MAIKCTTPQSAIDAFYAKAADILHDELITGFARLGEESVNRVRDREQEKSWFDDTGNLRSSIAYSVNSRGKEIIKGALKTFKNGTKGAQTAKDYLDTLAKAYSDTYALVVVAGMDYASYVEAMKSKDVLASTKLWAENICQKYIDDSIERATVRINALHI